MLSSKKLRTLLPLFLSLLWCDSNASPHRFYLILQAGDFLSQDYIGSVTVQDDTQTLAAQIFFPEGVVNIEMDILRDGRTVVLQVNPNQNRIKVARSSDAATSPLSRALQVGAGNPWVWFATSALTSYEFQLPEFKELSRIRLSSQATNVVGNISIQLHQTQSPSISNLSYVTSGLSLSPGSETYGLQQGVVCQVTDDYLFQLFELMIAALISPQLVVGQYIGTHNRPRDINDPDQKLPLKIDSTEPPPPPSSSSSSSSPPPPQQERAELIQRYVLSVWEGRSWSRHEVDVSGLKAVSTTPQGATSILTPQGRRFCFVMPVIRRVVSGASAALDEGQLLDGTFFWGWGSPYHCRLDSNDKNGKGGGFNDDSGPDSGGGGSAVH